MFSSSPFKLLTSCSHFPSVQMKHTQLPSTKDIFKKLFLNIQEKRNAFFLFIYAKVKRMREKKFSESITKRVTFDLKTFHSIPNYDDERGSEGINKKFPCFLYFKNQNQQTDWKQQKNKQKLTKKHSTPECLNSLFKSAKNK